MLALLGAMKEEIAELQSQIEIEETFVQQSCSAYKGKYKGKEVLLVQTGIGKRRAEKATELILERYQITGLLSFGFAGALSEELKGGDLIICSVLYNGSEQGEGSTNSTSPCYSDPDLVSLARRILEKGKVRFRQGSSVSVRRPVSEPAAKKALGEAFGAQAVDMESYWIAKITLAKHIPFLTVRAISDEVEDSLLPFDQLMDSEGAWLRRKAFLYSLSHPQHLPKILKFSGNLKRARKNLLNFIQHFIVEL